MYVCAYTFLGGKNTLLLTVHNLYPFYPVISVSLTILPDSKSTAGPQPRYCIDVKGFDSSGQQYGKIAITRQGGTITILLKPIQLLEVPSEKIK